MVNLDAESDHPSCQASQNNPRPAAPHQLPQPPMRGCNPSNDDATETVSGLPNLDELCAKLLEHFYEYDPQAESDGELIVTRKKYHAAGRSTSVHIRVHRGRSRSPRRQVCEPPPAVIPHAESHLGIAPAEGNEGKD